MKEITPRELAVAALVAKSKSTKQIAHELGITDRRVRALITSVAFKVGRPGLDDRVQVANWFRDLAPIHLGKTA